MVLPAHSHSFPGGASPLSGRTPSCESASQPAGLSGLRPTDRCSVPASRVGLALVRLYGTVAQPSPACPAAASVTSETAPDASAAHERRALPRRDSACCVHICVIPGDEPVQTQRVEWLLHASRQSGPMVDVSLRSVSALLAQAVAGGARVMLRLTNRRLDKDVDRSARVVRSVPLGADEWKVVCRLDSPLSLEELQQFARYGFDFVCV